MLRKTQSSAEKYAGARLFSLVPVLRRRVLRAFLAFCLILTLIPDAYAADNALTMDKCQRSASVYTSGDFAAARLAVYGILEDRFRVPQAETDQPLPRPDAVRLLWKTFDASSKTSLKSKAGTVRYSADAPEIPFTDILADYADAIRWAFESGVAQGVSTTEFGTYNTSQRAFVSMLLNALGYQKKFIPENALNFAESIGLTPVGLSRSFTLGDAALYLQRAAALTLEDGHGGQKPASERMNIPKKRIQEPFPATLCVTPYSVADAEALLRDATCRLVETVLIDGAHLTEEELFSFFSRYFMQEGERWYTSRVWNDCAPDIAMDTVPAEQLSEWERMDYNIILDSLRADWNNGRLSDVDYTRESELERIRRLASGRTITVRFVYNEAWELVCDLDDAFTLYKDDRITQRADSFYRAYVADADGDFDIVRSAEAAIVSQASYADPKGYEDGEPYYDDAAHSILGFFRNRRIVCDGYAKLFQYLTLRAGMDCVVVSGSTKSAADAADGWSDHAWNKIKVEGIWYNEDVCWIDTAYSQTYRLKSDEDYQKNRHWLVNFMYL